MNPRGYVNARVAIWTPAVLSLAIFAADITTPRGVVASVAYAPLMYFALWFKRPKAVFPFAYAITFLTLLGPFFKHPNGVSVWVVFLNRSLSLIVLWLATLLVHRYRVAEEALHLRQLSSMQMEVDSKTALLATIVEYSEDAIISKSLNGIIDSWNRGAQHLFGYTAAEAVGMSIRALIPPELFHEEDFIINELVRGRPTEHFETVRLHKNGKRIDVSVTVSPIKAANGQIIGASKVVRDISAKKLAELEAADYTRALIRSNKALDDFAYAASHDLKAPLRVIDNTSKWLEEDLAPHLTGDNRENMRLLRGRVCRMEKLLDDLLAYSRIGRKLDAEFVESIAGDVLIQDVLALLAPPSDFVIEISPRFAEIQVFRMPLQQIFLNLLGNAIKHHHKKSGRISLSVQPGDPMHTFDVKDDGPGIARQFHERIFAMFQTLKPRDQVEGSGMGLAMVRKYVEVFGGTVSLESAEGQGSTFHFTWPARQPRVGQYTGKPQ
jgi:PAS domain S-box-containing protein